MIWLQSIVVLLNRTALTHVFRQVYAFGLRRLLTALAQHPAVFCVFGCGSYFEGRCVYGLSDIDLIIVLRDDVQRSDTALPAIAYTYERVRRLFPFLGQWHEKEASVVFLADVRAELPLAESFRVRLKEGHLVRLYGAPLPRDLVAGPVTVSEALAELDTLLRAAVVSDERHTRRLVLWKRLFSKLIGLAATLDLGEVALAARSHAELVFLQQSDTELFFRRSHSASLFSLLLTLAGRICEAVQTREPQVRVAFMPFVPRAAPSPSPIDRNPSPSKAVETLQRGGHACVTHIPSVPVGLVPRLFYFSIDRPIPVIECDDSAYGSIRRVRAALRHDGAADENVLLHAEGFLFIVACQPTFVDLVPLDPVRFANVYAACRDGSTTFEMPASVFAEEQATADHMSRALAHLYRAHDGWVTKLSVACVYREDDADVIENGLRILRAFVATTSERVLIRRSGDLLEYLGQVHPECCDFLAALAQYRRSLRREQSAAPAANNIYRCLHQFMSQFLSGAPTIVLDPPHRHLGITVGVITRNRAADLAEMLDSLTRQVRLPDEVLVVDNGSTDDTQAVLERFGERLPLRATTLAEASIPKARNRVIEQAAHEIISFIDDDCIAEPGWLAAVERGFLRADNVGIVGGWVWHEPAARPSTVDNYYQVFHHTKP